MEWRALFVFISPYHQLGDARLERPSGRRIGKGGRAYSMPHSR